MSDSDERVAYNPLFSQVKSLRHPSTEQKPNQSQNPPSTTDEHDILKVSFTYVSEDDTEVASENKPSTSAEDKTRSFTDEKQQSASSERKEIKAKVEFSEDESEMATNEQMANPEDSKNLNSLLTDIQRTLSTTQMPQLTFEQLLQLMQVTSGPKKEPEQQSHHLPSGVNQIVFSN